MTRQIREKCRGDEAFELAFTSPRNTPMPTTPGWDRGTDLLSASILRRKRNGRSRPVSWFSGSWKKIEVFLLLTLFAGVLVFTFLPLTGFELLELTKKSEMLARDEPFVANVEDKNVLHILQEAALSMIQKDGEGEEESMHEFLDRKDFCHRRNGTRVEKLADRVKAMNNTVKSGRIRGGYYASKVISDSSEFLAERVDKPLLSWVKSSSSLPWLVGDYLRTFRYGGGLMHLSIHFDITGSIIIPLHGKREIFLLHPICDIPTEMNKHKSDFRQLCARINVFGFKEQQLRMRDVRCKSHRMKKVVLELGNFLYIPSQWYHSVESNNLWWISYVLSLPTLE